MKTYTVHFTGRTKNAIGSFYSMSDAFHAKDDADFIAQFWDVYELGTITNTNTFFFELKVNGVKHELYTWKFVGGNK